MDKEIRRALEGLLARDLDALTGAAPYVTARPGAVVRTWRLPAGDVEALVRWGLPARRDPRAASHNPTAAFQDGPRPMLTVPGAGDADGAGGENRERAAYRLADSRLREYGAVEGAGTVFGVPRPGNTTGGPVNTSVAAYVETVWRWICFCDVVDPLEERGDHDTFAWCLDRFAAWCVERDPEATALSATGQSWWESLTLS
ncbi:SUKH-4 family immunity protein [Streptomyces tritici]|uniref:SUKH-4 family immunity protein n=1 Tax=Streptomyces tritici TaxID=2054410 RepID=UPI003AF15DC9